MGHGGSQSASMLSRFHSWHLLKSKVGGAQKQVCEEQVCSLGLYYNMNGEEMKESCYSVIIWSFSEVT